MGEGPLVSVVIPVYNVEPYLAECVRSVYAQTYRKLEVILIDDGSTDGSAELCDELAREDKRAAVRHQANVGVSTARNNGIDACNGEWIALVDADDILSPFYIATLLSAADVSGASLVAIPHGVPFTDSPGSRFMRDEKPIRDIDGAEMLGVQEALLRLFYQQCDTAPQYRLYRRELLDGRPFPEGIVFGEDLACMYEIVNQAGGMALLGEPGLYAYRIRSNSALGALAGPEKIKSALWVSHGLYFDISTRFPDLADAAASRAFSALRSVFAQLSFMSPASRKVFHDLSTYRRIVLHDSHARRRERLAAMAACLGIAPFAVFCKLCRLFGLMR